MVVSKLAISWSPLDVAQWLCREREKYHKELENQAAEYKNVIKHHLSLNEKMLKEKEKTFEKCCNLAGILAAAETKVISHLQVWQPNLNVFYEKLRLWKLDC